MMDALMIGHRPGDDAATTLALAAAAALNGLGCDGRRLIQVDRLPSVAQIAQEAGLRRETARDALGVLREECAVVFKGDGAGRSLLVEVNPEALRDRWASYRQRCRLPVQLRLLGLAQNSMLLTGLVLGQRGRSGHCVLGRRSLVERTGWSLDVVRRALRSAVRLKAIKRWMVGDRLHLAAGERLAHPHGEEGDLSVSAPPNLSESAPPSCPGAHPDLSDSAPELVRFRTTPSGNPDTRTTTTDRTNPPAAVPAGGGGGGDAPHDQQQPESQQPAKLPEPTTAAAPAATRTPTDARAALAALRDEDARRALLTDPRPQVETVQDLLGLVGFATEHPNRRRAVAQAIADKRGDDATCWLLEVLHAIASDPTCDVPAILAHRLKAGLLDSTEPATGPTSNTSSRPPRPAQHDAGEGIRAENDRRRREALEADRERWLRDTVASRAFGDRAAPEVVANELGVTVEKVAAIVAQEQQRRTAEQQPTDAKARGGRHQQDAAAVDPAAKRAKWDAIVESYTAAGRKVPSHIREAFQP